MLHDLRYAARGLLRSPGFTVVAVLTLALGIGANTAVLSLAHAVFANPLPFGDPDQIVSLAERRDGIRNANIPVSGHEYEAWAQQNHVFQDLAVFRGERLNLTGGGEPESVDTVRVSANYLTLLQLQPALGRGFSAGEDLAGRNHVAVLSDRFWRRRFNADGGIIGRTVRLD